MAGTDGDPYWTRVWPSAVALAHQLLKRPELVRGCSVADLGAGLGVAGLAAALAGAGQSTNRTLFASRVPAAQPCMLLGRQFPTRRNDAKYTCAL